MKYSENDRSETYIRLNSNNQEEKGPPFDYFTVKKKNYIHFPEQHQSI